MSEEKNSSGSVFDDILDQSPISSLDIQEREFSEFSQDLAVKMVSESKEPKRKPLLKRTQKPKARQDADAPQSEQKPSRLPKRTSPSSQAASEKPEAESLQPSAASPAARPMFSDYYKKASEPDQEAEDAIFEAAAAGMAGEDSARQALEPQKESEPEKTESRNTDSFPLKKEAEDLAAADAKDQEEENQEEEEYQADPSELLEDDTDYDLYQDKRRFMLSDYKRIEDYLSKQSRQGYHYVRHEGKRYYFHKGEPKPYYYSMLYFAQEPVESQWKLWEDQGWVQISRLPAKSRREAGWAILRNEEKPGAFKREIENEQEKYRFFRKYSSSCRSTMFMLFICMAVCVIMAYLQYSFQGYIAGIVLCGVIFAAALWVFLMYARMLAKSKKQARLLKARLRLQKAGKTVAAGSEEAEQMALEDDWYRVQQESQEHQDQAEENS